MGATPLRGTRALTPWREPRERGAAVRSVTPPRRRVVGKRGRRQGRRPRAARREHRAAGHGRIAFARPTAASPSLPRRPARPTRLPRATSVPMRARTRASRRNRSGASRSAATAGGGHPPASDSGADSLSFHCAGVSTAPGRYEEQVICGDLAWTSNQIESRPAGSCRSTWRGLEELPKKPVGGEKQPIRSPCEARRDSGVAGRRRSQMTHARLPAQHPLTSDDRIVAERNEREVLRASPACGRWSRRSERPPGAQGVEAELSRPACHPAGMPTGRTEADPVCVQRDPVRPARKCRAHRRVAGVNSGRKREPDRSERDQR
jgi:hypothetical protein